MQTGLVTQERQKFKAAYMEMHHKGILVKLPKVITNFRLLLPMKSPQTYQLQVLSPVYNLIK